MKRIVRRALIILPVVAVQALWVVTLLKWLAPWATLIQMVLAVYSFLLVLYIVTKRDEGTYKILWLLVVLLAPLPGTALYLFFGNKRATRPLRKQLNAAAPLPPLREDAAMDALAAQDARMAQTFDFVRQTTGQPLHVNRDAQYYPLGDELFPAMLEAMESAERFIFAEYFIVEAGVMWDAMVEVMARKAAQGVDVRVLYDDLGSITTYSGKNAFALREKGIQCVPFNPLISVKGTLNYRDHRKMLIVDNRVAFSGGVNLADEYINRKVKFGHWKDVGFRVTGEAVENYTRMFAQFWNAFARPAAPIPPELIAPLPAPQTAQTDGFILSYYDSPLRDVATSNELLVELLGQAKDYAWFFTPYLMPGDALMDAFVRAARRGVDVRIIMPGIPDKKLVFRMSHSFYPVLLQAGVKIYEYEPGFVHAKACVMDDRVGTVGTVNLDYRSLFLHFENNALFYKASLLQDVKADFLATQAKCREMRLGENVKVGFWHWTLDGILRIFAPLC